MKRHLSALTALAAIVVTLIPVSLQAQDTEWNRYTLEGLGGVFVRADADAACESAGVTASSIQAEFAVKLIESDVDVLTEEEMLEHPGLPELRITIECVPGAGNGTAGTLAYSVSVRVQQSAQMLRDPQVTLAEAVTWYATEIGVASEEHAAASLASAIESKIEQFAAAYVAANAEEGGGS